MIIVCICNELLALLKNCVKLTNISHSKTLKVDNSPFENIFPFLFYQKILNYQMGGTFPFFLDPFREWFSIFLFLLGSTFIASSHTGNSSLD